MKTLFLTLISVLLFSAASAQTTKVIYTCPMHPEVQMSRPGNCPKCGMTLVRKTIRVSAPRAAPKKSTTKAAPRKPVKTTTAKSSSGAGKTTAARKVTPATPASSNTEMRQLVNEMKGLVQEMKTIVREMRGTDTDIDATDEHQHHQMNTTTTDTSKPVAKVMYTCPMHPEVQSDKPGKCPKCGMTLVRKTVTVNQPGMQMNTQQPQAKVVYTCPMHPEVQSDKPGKCPKCGMTLVRKTVAGGGPAPSPLERAGEEIADEIVGSKVNMQPGKTVIHHLYVRDTTVNFTGKNKRAIAINGTIPAPTLVFTEGDTAEIHLHNMLDEETSLHWHGIILPNRFDGVPFLTTKRIAPGDTYVYKFKIVQNGTYWYHSHSALQEQIGMYGALILKKRDASEMQHTTLAMPMDHSNMNMPTNKVKPETKLVYTCPMHPEIQQDKPGNCPICGMTLVRKTITVGGNKQQSANNTNISFVNPVSLKHYNVVLSEWTDDNPMQVQRRLRTANDWFSIKKGSTQSYSEAIAAGHFKTKLVNEWKRMKAMDVSDVWYPRFLINGQPETNAPQFKAGDRVHLHVVNAGASSYFWLTYGGGKITVVGNDGNEVMPVEVDRLIVAVAETFDIVVTIPDNMSYELRATSEDRTGASSLWLGTGMKMPAPKLPRLKYFEGMKMMNDMMNVDGTMKDMGHVMSLQKVDMNMVMYPEITGGEGDKDGSGNNMQQNMDHSGHGMNMPVGGDIVTLNYDMLRSPIKTSLPEGRTRTLHFSLTGNMNRYIWTLDNKTVTESDRIMIEKGENLRLILTNNSMMRHPMHLHGHDFRVVNSHGAYSPLKNVIDIMPMETDTIEFAANQDGNWFFHCHILYHMMAGMGRVFRYQNSSVNPDLPDAEEAYRKFRKHKDNNMKHLMARIGLESNGSDGEAVLSSNRYALVTEWRIGFKKHHGIESETMFGRYLGVNQWWFPYIGFDYHRNTVENEVEKNFFGQNSNQNNRKTFTVGVQYITPWLFLADARVDGHGKLRFELSREDIPITPRLRLNVMGNTDREYMAGLRYVVTKWFTLSTHYDSDMGYGAGITITY